jgi:hypothetical protein
LISEMDFGGGRIGGLLSDIPQNWAMINKNPIYFILLIQYKVYK